MPNLILTSPIEGWATPLDEAPDPVFAERMLGDGVAIDPTGSRLHAPCAGRIISVHHARHAVSLRAEGGAEILMHIGLETVALAGEGLTAHVADGQQVAAGDLLISFDIDLLARRATSLITPIIVTNGEAFAIVRRTLNRELALGDTLMELAPLASVAAESAAPAVGVSRTLVVALAHGVHARPAAVIAKAAKGYAADVRVTVLGRSASAKSPVALMALAIRHGDEITLSAAGSDADAAVRALAELITSGLGEAAPPPAAPPAMSPGAPDRITGVCASPGLAIGVAAPWTAPQVSVSEVSRGAAAEAAELAAAVAAVRTQLEGQAAGGPPERQAILGAHIAFLDDAELAGEAEAAIAAGRTAGQAWREAISGYVAMLEASPDGRLAQRAHDLIDLERQVLIALSGAPPERPDLPDAAILLADDLLPSELMSLDAGKIVGLVTAGGGPTSHVAIIAAAMGVPALVAAGPGVRAIPAGASLILDADAGALIVAPDAEASAAANAALAAQRDLKAAAQAHATEAARTMDGTAIEVFANLGSLVDARAAVANGAEGSGLLRTEFLFLGRATAPDEDEQAAAYQAIATALAGRPLTVRTLDVGGDKAVGYLAIPPEENPALGLRGVRVSLWRPELLRTQVRAILRVEPAGQCRIMAPMVASLDELCAVRAVVDAERAALGHAAPVEVGVMIETPAAAITADLLAAEADFLSVGTNDLTQYALAMDRGNPALSGQVDGLHPAVLRLIARAAEGAARHGRPFAICGGLASDPLAVPILIGLGATRLSTSAAMPAVIKALVRTLDMTACRALAAAVLHETSAAGVRALAIQAQTSRSGAGS